ncbi:MAG: type II secretion system protein GspC [Desulfosudaceae bacterium]
MNIPTIKYGIAAINVLLLTVLVYFTVNLMYTIAAGVLAGTSPAAGGQSQDKTVVTAAANNRFSDYAAIAGRNIFNAEDNAAAEPEDVDLESLKRTELDLRLLGTISGLGENSYAVIEKTREKRQNLYQVGDSVESATIKMILRKKVVLTIDGNDEVLEIPEENLAARPASPVRRQGGSAEREAGGPVEQVTLDRDKVQEAFSDVNQLMRTVRVRPHFSEGKPDGLRLDSVSPDSIFSEMGIKNKDVIVGVNNKRINTVDDCMDVYRNLSSESSVMLQVKRGDDIRRIQYRIE